MRVERLVSSQLSVKKIHINMPVIENQQVLRPARKKAQGESLARMFLLHWRAAGGPELEPEIVFHISRKWRFDFAHIESKVAIELEGGVYTNGAHVRGKHFESDCEKYNAAAAMGWKVFRLTRGLIGRVQITPIVLAVLTTDEHR